MFVVSLLLTIICIYYNHKKTEEIEIMTEFEINTIRKENFKLEGEDLFL